MRRWLQKILLFIAVATIVGHSSMPHHHVHIEAVAYHHDHDDEDHDTHNHYDDHHESEEDKTNLFSFAHLDESFVPEKYNSLSFELPLVYLLIPVIAYHYTLFKENSKTHFGFYKEYPPPRLHTSDSNRRGPPTVTA
jgi:hypothetical protein